MNKRYLIEAFLREYHKGEERAVHSKDLEALFFISGRDLRRLISELRKEEIPICSSRNGYFYAGSQADIRKCAKMLGSLSDGVNNSRMSLLSSRAPNVFGRCVIVIFPGGLM
ncbi:MAG: hypothetical protein IJM61_01935 [Firmicutes bacterium]|nr:hypothetical protein [Bacillota bacterium]